MKRVHNGEVGGQLTYSVFFVRVVGVFLVVVIVVIRLPDRLVLDQRRVHDVHLRSSHLVARDSQDVLQVLQLRSRDVKVNRQG